MTTFAYMNLCEVFKLFIIRSKDLDMQKEKKLLIGAHMSIAGGYANAIIAGESIGCTAIQIFTKSNRQWSAKPITPEDAKAFIQAWKHSSIESIMAHTIYLINVGSSTASVEKKSITALIDELERCHTLHIPYLVVHPGSCGTGSKEHCLQKISNNIDDALEQATGSTMILLENTAGQGTSVGATFEELAQLYKTIHHKKRIGFCIDTCHAFAAGYDLSTEKTYHEVWKKFDEIVGLEHLKALHMNDAKQKLGSGRDRHEHIGKGNIGLEGFRLLMNDPRFFSIPKVLETPKKTNHLEDDAHNLQTLKDLLTPKIRKLFILK